MKKERKILCTPEIYNLALKKRTIIEDILCNNFSQARIGFHGKFLN